MTVILDGGAFLSAERGTRKIIAVVKRELDAGRIPLTHGGVLAQVWRGGWGHQAPLARLLSSVFVAPIDEDLGKRTGLLIGAARGNDVADAALVALASSGDYIFTSDSDDLDDFAQAAKVNLNLVRV